ncbi:MAG: helix-turn-helix domain-containing protein [Bacteroidetes bacterium]|nr:helix-turn-helix domain-containing protein [Bacteroidota bacterium]
MEVICLDEPAFYALIDKVVNRINKEHGTKPEKWMNDEEAMALLNIKSKTTLQKLRDEGKIRFSQPQKKIILYDRASLDEYLEQHTHETF